MAAQVSARRERGDFFAQACVLPLRRCHCPHHRLHHRNHLQQVRERDAAQVEARRPRPAALQSPERGDDFKARNGVDEKVCDGFSRRFGRPGASTRCPSVQGA